MHTKTNQSIFTQLNNTKHRAIQDGQFSLFPDEKQNTPVQDTEYWFFSDIYNIHNNKTTETPNLDMNHIITKNLVMPKKTASNKIELVPHDTQFLADHTNTVKHAYNLGYHEYKHAKDLQLTRYACWCLVKNHTNNAFSYTYFISPIISENITFQDINSISYQFSRIPERATLARLNQHFNGIILNLNGTPAALNTKRIQSFFNNYTPQDLKSEHHITDTKSSILDYMGATSLSYFIDGLHDIISKSHTNKYFRNIYQFEATMHQELINARKKMILETGIKPEQDIQRINITTVQKEQKHIENEFIKKYANIKLR